jgi:hypothetical protein
MFLGLDGLTVSGEMLTPPINGSQGLSEKIKIRKESF